MSAYCDGLSVPESKAVAADVKLGEFSGFGDFGLSRHSRLRKKGFRFWIVWLAPKLHCLTGLRGFVQEAQSSGVRGLRVKLKPETLCSQKDNPKIPKP